MNLMDLMLARNGESRIKTWLLIGLEVAAGISLALAGIAALIIAVGKATGRI